MKVFCLLLITLCCSCSIKTTTHCYNEATKNIIYKGLPTPLTISSNKKIIEISTDKETKIERGNTNDKYTLITNQSKEIIVQVKTKNKTEKFHFRVKEIPEALLDFNRPIHNNEIKIDDFITLKSIRCYIPEIDLQISLKIKSMEIIRIDKDHNVYSEKCNVLDSKLIPLAKVGDIYVFNDIIIEYGYSEKTTKKNEVLKIIN